MAVASVISDESSFYGLHIYPTIQAMCLLFLGPADVKQEMEERVASFDLKRYWEIQQWSLQRIAARNAAAAPPARSTKRKREDEDAPSNTTKKAREDEKVSSSSGKNKSEVIDTSKSSKVGQESPRNTTRTYTYNPYEGDNMAKQSDESLGTFLFRLIPSKTNFSYGEPWIRISDPRAYVERHSEDIKTLKETGHSLLNAFRYQRRQINDQNPNKAAGSITRMLKTARDKLEADLLQLAKSTGVICGKWMMFCNEDVVDGIWTKIAINTFKGKLGIAAKVATGEKESGRGSDPRLVCVYTRDFGDIQDVKRVLDALKSLDVVGGIGNGRSNAIYYKCDAYTYLDITSQNEFKLKASM